MALWMPMKKNLENYFYFILFPSGLVKRFCSSFRKYFLLHFKLNNSLHFKQQTNKSSLVFFINIQDLAACMRQLQTDHFFSSLSTMGNTLVWGSFTPKMEELIQFLQKWRKSINLFIPESGGYDSVHSAWQNVLFIPKVRGNDSVYTARKSFLLKAFQF